MLQHIAEEEVNSAQPVQVRFDMEGVKSVVDPRFRGNIPWIK
jgi:hypothetical protein